MENTIKNKLKKTTDIILDVLPNTVKETVLGIKRFTFFKQQYPPRQLFIQIIDGRETHGGLADRLKGIVSAFCLADSKGMQFKIHHTYPFALINYLQPNLIDWRLTPEDKFSSNIFESRIMHITDLGNDIIRFSKSNTKKQFHAYCKGDLLHSINLELNKNYDWSTVFHKLFKPSIKLQKEIDDHSKIIGGPYISVVFRFQNLLADFPEYNYPTLAKSEQKNLIEHCSRALLKLQKQHINSKILVSSDSVTFQNSIIALKNIFTFPKKVVHMDYISGENFEVYLKSFLDFYLIANSEKIYSMGTSIMYKTNFPKYAANLNNIQFERIEI
ncbi:O-fucosyltransferase family protein [Rhizosphaericola mali]|uniref:Uncharacterized protein n=1 Tax=Rhizosphaericola mali TaxID=2545455 RepID=A0A5P2GAH8_9BACT|nr:hypothetical protein [Rhizosphaericola mali]QES90183.1 hypothetical protein E0W69_016510 [Rhizosphaericola mali]